MRGLWRHDPVWVFLAALVVRAGFAWETRDDPLFSILAIDARSYFELAQRFAAGDWLYGREPLWFPPLYPTLVGMLFRVLGPDPTWVRLVQFLLGAGTAALATAVGARFSRAAGLVAGLALAVSPPAIFSEGQLLYTSLAVFLTALFLAGFLAATDPRSRARTTVGAGVALGVLGLVRTNSLAFLPVGVFLLARRRGARPAAAFATAALLMLVPVLLRNGLAAGEWTPLTVNGGMVFSIGFAQESRGGRALQQRPDDFGPGGLFEREAERATGREMTLAEASRFHRDRALERITADPIWAARLTLRKLALLANVREIDDNLGIAVVRDRSHVLSWLPGFWAWVWIPAAFGAAATARRRDRRGDDARVLILYAAAYSASLLLFFVSSRYRLPLVVPGAALAGAAIPAVRSALRAGAGRRLAIPAALAVAAAVPVLRDPGVRADPAYQLLAVGAALERDGHHADALAASDRALALDPELAAAHQNRALSLHSLGRGAEALEATRQATRLDPDLVEAWLTQGAILAGDGRIAEALPAFRRAVELEPGNAAALENLARALAETGRPEEALEVGRRAVEAGARRLAPLLAEWELRISR